MRRRREQYMPLVAFCLRHFSADSIICMYVFEFRQAQLRFRTPQHPVKGPLPKNAGFGVRPKEEDRVINPAIVERRA